MLITSTPKAKEKQSNVLPVKERIPSREREGERERCPSGEMEGERAEDVRPERWRGERERNGRRLERVCTSAVHVVMLVTQHQKELKLGSRKKLKQSLSGPGSGIRLGITLETEMELTSQSQHNLLCITGANMLRLAN